MTSNSIMLFYMEKLIEGNYSEEIIPLLENFIFKKMCFSLKITFINEPASFHVFLLC